MEGAHTPAPADLWIQILRPVADWSAGAARMFFASTGEEVEIVEGIAADIGARLRGADTEPAGFERKFGFGTELEVDRFHRELYLGTNW